MTVIEEQHERHLGAACPKTLGATRLPGRKWGSDLMTGSACEPQRVFDGAAGQVAPAGHRRQRQASRQTGVCGQRAWAPAWHRWNRCES